jgi:hypothetical protein
MFRSSPGGNDAADTFIAIDSDNEENAAAGHSDDDVAFFPVIETIIRFFDAIGVFQSGDRIAKIHTVQAQI